MTRSPTGCGTRLGAGLRRIAYFVVPSAAAFLAFGDVIAAALFETGQFSRDDSRYVWALLAGSSRRTARHRRRGDSIPRRSTRCTTRERRSASPSLAWRWGSAVGALLALYAPRVLGIAPRWGAAGITIASGLGAWLELALLRSALRRAARNSAASHGRGAATLGAVPRWRRWLAWGVKLLVGAAHPWVVAALVLGTFAVAYVVITTIANVDEARALLARASRSR